jgi:hypothetical protein
VALDFRGVNTVSHTTQVFGSGITRRRALLRRRYAERKHSSQQHRWWWVNRW